jgi:hypothetical protein
MFRDYWFNTSILERPFITMYSPATARQERQPCRPAPEKQSGPDAEKGRAMTASTRGRGARVTGLLRLSGIAALLLAAGCQTNSSGDPSISANDTRTSAGVLEKLTVKGSHFTPNGPVKVTVLMSGGSANASPYVEEDIQADTDGKIRYEKQPVACPQPADYGQGSWTLVVARDMTSGISGSAQLSPGGQPDCGS